MKKWQKRGTFNTVSEIIEARKLDVEAGKKYPVINLREAAEALKRAVCENRLVTVIADYDADGVMSGLIMTEILRFLKARFVVLLPDRESEGYGISEALLKRLPNEEHMLIVTVDNGIAAVEYIDALQEKGHEVVVMDHHLKREDGKVPGCIVVDQHIYPEAEFTGYCGAGLAYKLALELGITDEVLNRIICYAGIATVQDSVPLLKENRDIVANALSLMNSGNAPAGISLLFEKMGRKGTLRASDIAFGVGAAVNAPGRTIPFGAGYSYRALGTANEALIIRMVEMNRDRKQMCSEEEALVNRIIEDEGMQSDGFIVVADPAVHPGIMGITASRIVEKYHVPVIVAAPVGDVLKGSGRSTEDVHLKNELDKVKDLLVRYGGHKAAAGMSFKPEDLSALRKALCKNVPKKPFDDTSYYDVEIDAEEMANALSAQELGEPYGEMNPEIVYKVTNFKVVPGRGGMYRKVLDGYSIASEAGDAVTFKDFDRYAKDGFPTDLTVYGTLGADALTGRPRLFIADYEFAVKEEEHSDLMSELFALV